MILPSSLAGNAALLEPGWAVLLQLQRLRQQECLAEMALPALVLPQQALQLVPRMQLLHQRLDASHHHQMHCVQ